MNGEAHHAADGGPNRNREQASVRFLRLAGRLHLIGLVTALSWPEQGHGNALLWRCQCHATTHPVCANCPVQD